MNAIAENRSACERKENLMTRAKLSTVLGLLFCLMALVWLTSCANARRTDSPAQAPTTQPTNNAFALRSSHFDIGGTYLRGGDKITIDEIRGTSDKIEPGNLYEIK